ncbi:MAG TPA: prolyl oligopeptidase family serine peptidase [Micromonosporaceae bacterium]|nr:prolyl oligopeptidase family serine peptidase [Micromonosporaceae bacterium]
MEYPELAARTRRFTYGAPRAVTVGSDGARVAFLRSRGPEDPVDALWVFDVATAEERLIADPAVLLAASGEATELSDAERALRERTRLAAAGIGTFATDPKATIAAFTLGGKLFSADLRSGDVRRAAAASAPIDPWPDPTGRRIAYVSTESGAGALRITSAISEDPASDALIAAEEGISWGLAEFIAAEEFGRYRGYWWSPDGNALLAARVDESRVNRWHLADPTDPGAAPRTIAYPHAGSTNAEVSLHLLDLEGGWVDVHWDRETYPYVVAVAWSETGGPLITVLRRLQQHGLVLAVDPRTGETQVHAELADPRWVEPIGGTPMYLPDGRVLVGGELAHDGYDARCLFADGTLVSPPGLYVRRVCGRVDGGDLVVEASDGEPSEVHLFRVSVGNGMSGVDVTRLTSVPGVHAGVVGGATLVIGSASLDHAGTQWSVLRIGRPHDKPGAATEQRGAADDQSSAAASSVGIHRPSLGVGVAGGGDLLSLVGSISNLAANPPFAPRPALERVTDRRIPVAVVYPRSHVAGRRLPVLVDIYGGPGHQEVVAARARWLDRQWWADAGFAVVTIDNRGTPGVAPSFEKVIHRRMTDVVIGDQVDALHALADKHTDLDLARVVIRGWSFGGWLSALAALKRPDIYKAAVVGAPVTDWELYDTAYTERYLGLPGDGSEVYAHHSIVELAREPIRPGELTSPMLLVHGFADDNVVAANTLRLSAALLATGRTHAMIPLPGASHMAAGGLRERLMRLELRFLRESLGIVEP